MKTFLREYKKLFSVLESKYKVFYGLYIFFSFVGCALFVLLTYLYALLIDDVTGGTFAEDKFYVYIGVLFGSLLIFRIFSFMNVFIRNKVKLFFYKNVFHASIFKGNKDAAIFSAHTEKTGVMFTDYVFMLPSDIFEIIGIVLFVAIISGYIAFVFLAGGVFFFIISRVRDKKVSPLYERSREESARLTDDAALCFASAADITLNGAGQWASDKLAGRWDAYMKKARGYERGSFVASLFSRLNGYFVYIAAVGLGFLFFTRGQVTLGLCVAVAEYVKQINDDLSSVYSTVTELDDYTAHLKAVNAVMHREENATGGVKITDTVGALRVSNVSFSYNDTPLLSRVSFSVEKGETLALTGKSGAGKTTLLSLITGKLKPRDGEICVRRGLRAGYLDQFPYVFNRSILDNLRLADETASEAEMESVLLKTGLRELWERRYEISGENGYRLSGGQRARLALARLILFEPDIVLLDEPLRGADGTTRKFFFKFLSEYLKDKAAVIVSHDAEILKIATAVYGL